MLFGAVKVSSQSQPRIKVQFYLASDRLLYDRSIVRSLRSRVAFVLASCASSYTNKPTLAQSKLQCGQLIYYGSQSSECHYFSRSKSQRFRFVLIASEWKDGTGRE